MLQTHAHVHCSKKPGSKGHGGASHLALLQSTLSTVNRCLTLQVSVHMESSSTAGAFACIHFRDEASAKQLQAQDLPPVMGGKLQITSRVPPSAPGEDVAETPGVKDFACFCIIQLWEGTLQRAFKRRAFDRHSG